MFICYVQQVTIILPLPPENISWLRPLRLDWCRLYISLHKCCAIYKF